MRAFQCWLIVLGVGWAGAVLAQVPTTIGYNGILFHDGACCGFSYDGPMTFKLFPTEEGGTAVWYETHDGENDPVAVDPTTGAYHVELGKVSLLPVNAFDGDRWLQVTLGGQEDEPLSGRIHLEPVAFAQVCQGLGASKAGAFNIADHALVSGAVGIGTFAPGARLDVVSLVADHEKPRKPGRAGRSLSVGTTGMPSGSVRG